MRVMHDENKTGEWGFTVHEAKASSFLLLRLVRFGCAFGRSALLASARVMKPVCLERRAETADAQEGRGGRALLSSSNPVSHVTKRVPPPPPPCGNNL